MKNHIIRVLYILAVLLVSACQDTEHSPYGSDGEAPGPVIVTNIINTHGGAVIHFTSPSDVDVLYVSAELTDDKGNQRQVKVSAILDSLTIEGLGKVGEYSVSMYAVDRGENLSDVTIAVISPLEPPVNLVFPTITGVADFGGLKVSYENPEGAAISINITEYDSTINEDVYRESFYTSQNSGTYTFRGFKGVATRFGVYIEDKWENRTEMAYFLATPIPDEFMDKEQFSIFKLSGDADFNKYGFNEEQIWDSRWGDQWNCGHSDFFPLPHYLTMNLGANVKLSRFKLYQRGGDELYKHGNPKHFRIYGCLDVNDLPPYSASNPNAGWTLLKECYSFKPSGLPIGSTTNEDHDYQNKGEDFEFDVNNLIEVRYIRIENLETWGEQQVTVIGELSFWGELTEPIQE